MKSKLDEDDSIENIIKVIIYLTVGLFLNLKLSVDTKVS